jgi:D-hexose-6-phosphate mutarotase
VVLVPICGVLTQKITAYRMVTVGSLISALSVFFIALPAAWFKPLADGWLGNLIGHQWLGVVGAVNPLYISIFFFIVLLSVGEALWSPRLYEYAAAIAPKGQEASYMALSMLPYFLAKFFVGGTSGWLLAKYCPETGARHPEIMWFIIGCMALVTPAAHFCSANIFKSTKRALNWPKINYGNQPHSRKTPAAGNSRPRRNRQWPRRFAARQNPHAVEHGGNLSARRARHRLPEKRRAAAAFHEREKLFCRRQTDSRRRADLFSVVGPRDGEPAHGFARFMAWELIQATAAADGVVTIHFALPKIPSRPAWQALRTELIVTVAETLTMELVATNESCDETFSIENCLHTYFQIGDINQISLTGLQGTPFDDFAAGAAGARKVENDSVLRIAKETNRVYPDNTATVEIHDAKLKRTIRVEKSQSNSTVVWNPWTTQKLPDDFDPAEYTQMVCVESGNVKQNKLSLAPGKTAALKVVLHSENH